MASALLTVISIATGLLALLEAISGARPFCQGAGGALLGLQDALLSPRATTVLRSVVAPDTGPAAAAVPMASALLGVTLTAMGLLSLLKAIFGAKPFCQRVGGALVGLWDARLSLKASAAGRRVVAPDVRPAAATVPVVAVGAGPAGLLPSSGARSVLVFISGATVLVRGSTISPATQKTHPEMGPETGEGGTRAWPENGTEGAQPPMAALQKQALDGHEHSVEHGIFVGLNLVWADTKKQIWFLGLLFWLARLWNILVGGN